MRTLAADVAVGAAADDALPGAGDLLAPGGGPPLAAFLDRNGWAMIDARAEQVRLVPGRSCATRYQVIANDRLGRPRHLQLTAEVTRRSRELPAPPPELAARIGLPEPVASIGPHRVWAFPYDPDLPDLAEAMDRRTVCRALSEAGLVDGRPVAVSVDLLRYRPGRRAVIRYTVLRAGQRPQRLFGKVLRPHRADRLDAGAAALRRTRPGRRHRQAFRLALPQRLFGAVFVAPAATGVPLRDRLLRGGALPHPRRIAELPALLADTPRRAVPVPFDERREPVRLAEHAAGLLRQIAPSTTPAVDAVVDAVHAGVASGWAPTRLVHGDLYDDQLFVSDDFSLELVDFDDLGPGDPAMDAANCCAHLVVLAGLFPVARGRLVAYRQLVRQAFLERLELTDSELAWREALAVMLLATGPFRVLTPNWPSETAALTNVAARLAGAVGQTDRRARAAADVW